MAAYLFLIYTTVFGLQEVWCSKSSKLKPTLCFLSSQNRLSARIKGETSCCHLWSRKISMLLWTLQRSQEITSGSLVTQLQSLWQQWGSKYLRKLSHEPFTSLETASEMSAMCCFSYQGKPIWGKVLSAYQFLLLIGGENSLWKSISPNFI